ncbi:4915_t:CDS:2 [Acaulospora morrowiae]|uniref:4915_t:CDS:1 n=1 Tax=Acaulospora morrowiae TaxID=94023 RepID=A0A9N8ZAA4_9GLOM|nr:4915_t:CDS:2 [Acaulospora morrowiae]
MEIQSTASRDGEESSVDFLCCTIIEKTPVALCKEIKPNPFRRLTAVLRMERKSSASRGERDDPRNWSKRKKNSVIFIIAIAAMLTPLSTTILIPALLEVCNDLHATEIHANGLIAVFILFSGIAPLGWASYSDAKAQRRKAYLASLVLFQIVTIICGFTNNIYILIVMRALQACGSSAAQSVGAGCISDIFDRDKRGRAYGIFYVGPLMGPLIGPIIGGYLTQYLGWRWIFWFLAVFGGFIFLIVSLALPETSRGKPSQSHFNPLAPLALLSHSSVSLSLLYIASLYSIIYVQNTLMSRNFVGLYHIKSSEVGLAFLSPSIGFVIGSVAGGKYSDIMFKRAKERNSGVGYPEMQLNIGTLVAMAVFQISYVNYGWMIARGIRIVFPLITMFLGGLGYAIVFNSISTCLINAFQDRSASIIAVNNFVRALAAGGMSLAAAPLQDVLVAGWLYTIMVGFNILGSGCLVLSCVIERKRRKNRNLEI